MVKQQDRIFWTIIKKIFKTLFLEKCFAKIYLAINIIN